MTKKKTLRESASRDERRLSGYKAYSLALSYPGEKLFASFPGLRARRDTLVAEYDRLFRNSGVWLYTAEYTAKGEFQTSQCLSDIMGFYKAFGLEPDKERPDAVSTEFEFMHYLIFKAAYAVKNNLENAEGKALLCLDAQRKFFDEHVYPGARAIAENILSHRKEGFYARTAAEMLAFLESERKALKTSAPRGSLRAERSNPTREI